MTKRIVYTRPGNKVSICAPSHTALRYMTGKGGRWDDILQFDKNFLNRQVIKQAEECGLRNAIKFIGAMQYGGLTLMEAYEVMRDRFCAHLGTGCEIWDTEEVAKLDRKYRDAWRRSHNGGPIYIDEYEAMLIDERLAWEKYYKIKGSI